nr:tudor domain-containing 6-like [Nerophis lumbriciformis]
MSSIFGLPTQGSNVTILITWVDVHPRCLFIEFWANFGQARAVDYESLTKNIQSPANLFQEFEGNPGDLCLVQNEIDGRWYRSRIVTRSGCNCKVFLIDKGITCITTTKLLAWGNREYFHLPPEVEFCLLANVVPLSPENIWSPSALEFVKSFQGKTVRAYVQDVLVHQRKLILDIPCITKCMQQMGLTKKLEPSMFLDVVLKAQEPRTEAEKFDQNSVGEVEQLNKKDLYMYPELTKGAVETVVVTEVTNPQRIFCQLKIFSQELNKISQQITKCCQGRMVRCSVDPEMIGFPCAARGNDGNWYRSVLQQVFPSNKLLEVLNVDYGTKQLVQMENVRPLAPEFFRMPVVTYVCSLHGVIDKGVGWTSTQINYLKSLLLHKTLIAKFQYQSVTEGVYYVTLYGDENKNLNNMFCSKDNRLLESEQTPADYATGNMVSRIQHPSQFQNQGTILPFGQTAVVEEKVEQTDRFPVENVFPGTLYVARVSHVTNPHEFWIQTQNHTNELDELMGNISHLYKYTDNKYVMETPTLGANCAAKAADGDFYRGVVSGIGEDKIKVFFVDYGGTEEVDRSDIRTLPDRLQETPKLALKCSLAGIGPKDSRWSRCATDFFIKVTTNKLLNVEVMKKHDLTHVVTLMDPKSREQRDIGSLLCSSGLAERNDIKKASQISTEQSKAGILCDFKNVPPQALINPFTKESKPGKFPETMFPIGSVLDVNVSYITSPNDFWCQLNTNSRQLKLMMHNIQAHYAGSIYEPFTESACVVRHPDNGKWYRGIVVQKHEQTRVTVLFVDYGQTKTVSLYDLRAISHEFLELHSQAFRCSLFNPSEVMSASNDWNDDEKGKFVNFVETASSDFGELKCTVYAVMYNEQKIVFNIVDLETPFESICTTMAKCVHSMPHSTVQKPSFHLNAYYYSAYNIKIGNEEQVKVSCVNSVSQFYCQLERNGDMLKDLNVNVNRLCLQLGNVKPPKVFGTLCFAKYVDGLWYRGQIKAIKPKILVHFVDYGDTAQVDESDLLPVPKEATNIMSVPVQAVVCCLSDVPTDVPREVNDWFQTSVTDGKYQALVVAKEPSGSLQVELYHKNIQINSQIKNIFHLKGHTEGQVLYQHRKAPEFKKEKEAMSVGPHTNKQLNGKPEFQVRQATQYSRWNLDTNLRAKTPLGELYQPPYRRQHEIKPKEIEKEENVTITNDSKSPIKDCGNVLHQTKHPKRSKLEDLHKNVITMGMAADVYVSHYNSPASFYVQLVSEEDKIFSLGDKLNDATPKISIPEVDVGDLVVAEFADDSLWYRAGVKEVFSDSMVLVEFVDFGNTAQLPLSKLAKLHQAFELLPRYSTHCMLSEAESLEVLDAEVVSTLKKDIGSNPEKKLKCHFVQEAEGVWQVTLEDNGVQITCETPAACPEIPSDTEEGRSEQNTKPSPNVCSRSYHQIDFTEGQRLDVYISAVCDAHTFWCQPADSVALDNLSESLSEIGKAAHNTNVSISAQSPGMPCIAFFADDQLWCRAEVLNKNGDVLSVVFVDYGNTSEITITDVREISSDLLETPKQAFLCKLEGFDDPNGSWCEGAFDALASVTEDKLLQMTVTKPSRDNKQNMHLVQLECEGQLLNETMKSWWVTSTLKTSPDVTQLVLDKHQDPIDESERKPENEPSDTEDARHFPDADTESQWNDAEFHNIVASTPKNIQSPLDFLQISSPTENLQEESHSPSEVISTVPAVLIPHMETSVSQIDSGIEVNVLPFQNVAKNSKILDDEEVYITDASLSDENKSPPEKTMEKSGIQLTPFEVLDTCTIEDCSQVQTYFPDPNVASDDDKDADLAADMNGTKVKMCYTMAEDEKSDFPESEDSVLCDTEARSLIPLSPDECRVEEVIGLVRALSLTDKDDIDQEKEAAMHVPFVDQKEDEETDRGDYAKMMMDQQRSDSAHS